MDDAVGGGIGDASWTRRRLLEPSEALRLRQRGAWEGFAPAPPRGLGECQEIADASPGCSADHPTTNKNSPRWLTDDGGLGHERRPMYPKALICGSKGWHGKDARYCLQTLHESDHQRFLRLLRSFGLSGELRASAPCGRRKKQCKVLVRQRGKKPRAAAGERRAAAAAREKPGKSWRDLDSTATCGRSG